MTEGQDTQGTEKLDLTSRLFRSVERGKTKKVKFFLDLGIDVNVQNEGGYSMLVPALYIQNDEKRERTFVYLLNTGVDPAKRDKVYQRNALIWACILERKTQLERLIREYGGEIDLNEGDANGMTLLHHATQKGNISLVRCVLDGLLKFELSVDIPDSLGLTPYLHAKRLGFEDIAELLRKQGKASPGQCDRYSHMNANEWSMIGEEERKRRLLSNIETPSDRHVKGRNYASRPGRNIPNLEAVPSVNTGASVNTLNNLVKVDAPLQHSASEPLSGSLESRFPSLSNLSDSQRKLKISDSQSLLSLLNLSARASAPDNFFKSHFDNSTDHTYQKGKPEDQRNNFAMLMSVLSDESCPSFRQPVRPKIEEPEPALDLKKPNVSTLAILLGKKIKKRNSFINPPENPPKVDKNIHRKLLDVMRRAKKSRAVEINVPSDE